MRIVIKHNNSYLQSYRKAPKHYNLYIYFHWEKDPSWWYKRDRNYIYGLAVIRCEIKVIGKKCLIFLACEEYELRKH